MGLNPIFNDEFGKSNPEIKRFKRVYTWIDFLYFVILGY